MKNTESLICHGRNLLGQFLEGHVMGVFHDFCRAADLHSFLPAASAFHGLRVAQKLGQEAASLCCCL